MKPAIINIVNFIRGCEPREPINLYEPLEKQLELLEKHDMTGTFLVQYDAMLDEKFLSLLKGTRHEIGGWFEIVQPQVEAIGLKWRGRFPWDWHNHVGFPIGYAPNEREMLVDEFMKKFKEIFGYFPKTVGSWIIDTHTFNYMHDKYKISASCNCKDQWGTDGYTLWGGYWNQAYYPSKNNVFTPAQTKNAQIDVPIFRMLGSDPIYQYGGMVVTLEPVYAGKNGGGGRKDWIEWFFNDVLNSPSLSFAYAQVGQENSFGWEQMSNGLIEQFVQLEKLREQGKIIIETLGESAEKYREKHEFTPNSATVALSDWKNEGHKSVWFYSLKQLVKRENSRFCLKLYV